MSQPKTTPLTGSRRAVKQPVRVLRAAPAPPQVVVIVEREKRAVPGDSNLKQANGAAGLLIVAFAVGVWKPEWQPSLFFAALVIAVGMLVVCFAAALQGRLFSALFYLAGGVGIMFGGLAVWRTIGDAFANLPVR